MAEADAQHTKNNLFGTDSAASKLLKTLTTRGQS